ncbi:putative protein N(5)-glutamine methyltransferase [Ruania halotolerans]|uniref:putative protein N(5)-glutamine methyltransferase n=1 Tax=Ruania halotolerans TaxID=2897773 RepID=UPI001E3FF297|nr:putative protein N(5)-glutamine methyltransferase [Ruania halotolerans]UFU08270.1 putative protein N(5)-glutamine methyltransferase [Ruania halotolerans]
MARLRAAGCVFAEAEAALLNNAAAAGPEREVLVRRRLDGEPLETVLGWVEFDGLRLYTAPGVFVPRTRTTHLVEVAAEVAPHGAQVADVCCGIGAIAAALHVRRPDLMIRAADLDPRATACAADNLDSIPVYTGDLLEALPPRDRGRLDLVVANTPYVPTAGLATMPREAREYEPVIALDGGTDGLSIQRRLAGQADHWLSSDGLLLTEIAEEQRQAAQRAFRETGWTVELRPSPRGENLVVMARRRH